MTSLVQIERRGHVALLWMCDSARRNALSVALVTELLDALRGSEIADARAIVIGSREKAFCAGADIRDMLESGWLEASSDQHDAVTPPHLFEAIESDSRLIIAAVDGLALGGGVELCLACDLVVAATGASFMLPELGLGVLPNTALARLPALIGMRAAADLILTRRRIMADEALRLGLISSIAEEGFAMEQAVASAQTIVSTTPPRVLAAARRQLRGAPGWYAIRAILNEMDPGEWREGTSAFVEKRTPNYDPFWAAR
ncbi:MAG TPA: enoyl-CoA hydratase/isomerase family protein [Novosphingobium sp.]|nr:enoyl-CoA hydratase/isomerase family protein [Novosphingobium sp.]